MDWYLQVLRKYADFAGRARRKEYWYFILFNTLFFVLLYFLDVLLGLDFEEGFGVLSGLYALAVLIPALAVSARRLHDIGRSAWWLLIMLIPFGALVLLVGYVQDSERGENAYGPSPKYEVEPAFA